jgi:hypothetical protein
MDESSDHPEAIRIPATSRLRSAGYLLTALVAMLATMAMAGATVVLFGAAVAGAVIGPVDPTARVASLVLVSVLPLVVLALLSRRGRQAVIGCALVLLGAGLTINMWAEVRVMQLLPLITACAAGLFGLITATAIRRAERLDNPERWERVWLERGQCPACGYRITGLREPRCPECGRRWTMIEPREGTEASD